MGRQRGRRYLEIVLWAVADSISALCLSLGCRPRIWWDEMTSESKARLGVSPEVDGRKIVRRRLLLLLGAAAVPAVMGFVACGSEGSGGTREDPYPYSKDRVDRLRTQM